MCLGIFPLFKHYGLECWGGGGLPGGWCCWPTGAAWRSCPPPSAAVPRRCSASQPPPPLTPQRGVGAGVGTAPSHPPSHRRARRVGAAQGCGHLSAHLPVLRLRGHEIVNLLYKFCETRQTQQFMQCLGKFKVKISPNENVYINKNFNYHGSKNILLQLR